MSKILIVTHWFYPRQNPRAFRAFELYRELSKRHSVDVLVGDWKCQLKHDEDYHKLDEFGKQDFQNKNARLSNKKIIQIGLKIVQYFIGERYLLSSGRFISRNMKLDNYNAVISIGLPFYSHWLTANKIRKMKCSNITSISDWGDPFYGDKVRRIAPYFKSIQKKTCNTFDYIVTPTEKAVPYYQEYKDNHEGIKVIPQGFNFDEVQVSNYKPTGVPHFAYAGIFYSDKRNPEEFLKFLTTIDRDFVFTVYTVTHGPIYNDILMKYKKILGDKFIINDMVPRLDCIKLLCENDFLINIDNLSAVQVPSKLIDYSLTKRPILSFTQDNIPKDKIKKFFDGDYSDSLKISIDEFNIKRVAEKFDALITD